MVEGFWVVQFEGMQGGGGGVVFLAKGKVLGGDSGYLYMGTYEADQQTIKARVSVTNFIPGVGNVLGVNGDFELALTGAIEGDSIKGTASLIQPAGVGIAVKLTRKASLP